MLPTRVVNSESARARYGTLADRLFEALAHMDPLADEAIASLTSRDWIERGCAQEDLSGAPAPLRRFFSEASKVPTWVDRERVDRAGRILFRSSIAGGMTLGAKSLIAGYCSPGGNKPLVFSGQLQGQVQRRLAETGKFVVATCTEGALWPGNEGWAITLRVRLMHAQVRRLILASDRWNERAWGAPINQHDMVATALLFSIVFLDGIRDFGVPVSRQEADDFLHLWRYSSWLMGVEESLLPRDEPEARNLADVIALTQGDPDDDARALTSALLESPRGTLQNRTGRLAEWQIALGQGVCRGLLGEELADALHLPRTRWRHIVPAARRVAALMRMVGGPRPDAYERFGHRYWERNVRLGLGGAPAAFALPGSLAGRFLTRRRAELRA
ncbi:MAG: oxygenase MpaB family protein [Myxococcota bacterium]